MEEIAFCKTCGTDKETIFHAFFECTWARLFWQELKKIAQIKIPVLRPNTWAIDLIDSPKVSRDMACVILCGCWAVWNERNVVWHGDGGRSVTASVRWVTELTFDLAQLGKKKILKPVKLTPSWTKPIDGFSKINVDAGFIAEAREGTTGSVVSDQSDGLMAAQALWYNDAANSLIMEAVAVRDGVQFVVDRHF